MSSAKDREHLAQVGDDNAPSGLPDCAKEPLQRDNLLRVQIHA